MKPEQIEQYAKLLTTYCCNISSGDRVYIRSTYLAESLVRACQKEILIKGGVCEYSIALPDMAKQYYEHSNSKQLAIPPLLYAHAIKSFDVIITIHAPYDLFELKDVDDKKLEESQVALRPIKKQMMKRSSTGDLRWVLCNYPTQALAKAAAMSLNDYSQFISNACFLNKSNPQKEWEKLFRK